MSRPISAKESKCRDISYLLETPAYRKWGQAARWKKAGRKAARAARRREERKLYAEVD